METKTEDMTYTIWTLETNEIAMIKNLVMETEMMMKTTTRPNGQGCKCNNIASV